jgi:hypothetical protein
MKWNKIIITKWNIYSYQKALNQDYAFINIYWLQVMLRF